MNMSGEIIPDTEKEIDKLKVRMSAIEGYLKGFNGGILKRIQEIEDDLEHLRRRG